MSHARERQPVRRAPARLEPEAACAPPCKCRGTWPAAPPGLGPFGNACKFMRMTVHISRCADFLSIGLALEAQVTSLGGQRFAPPGRPMFQNENQRDVTR